MKISHKVDYGVRAMVSLAAAQAHVPVQPTSRDVLAAEHGIPAASLEDILRELAKAGLAKSRRGAVGGWLLARPAAQVTVADVMRALDGPLASVRGIRPHELGNDGADPYIRLWVAVRAALRSVLETVTLADLVEGRLPPEAAAWLDRPRAWEAP
ncbi:MAG TPA: Rrf2 family transcriptional regulator [Acidimicrobiales bacterium]|nr:Rrf2 family transcriptional regulator [Acidimicrobiales bacterium]